MRSQKVIRKTTARKQRLEKQRLGEGFMLLNELSVLG